MKNLLLHPKATLAILIAGCGTIVTFCSGIAAAVQPMASVPAFSHVVPQIQLMCLVLGGVSSAAVALAAMGRSIISTIDSGKEVQDAVKAAEVDDSSPNK